MEIMQEEYYFLFFFNDPATTEIYPLSLHDALPFWTREGPHGRHPHPAAERLRRNRPQALRRDHLRGDRHVSRRRGLDRKSTRLNSSHANISYAVFCLKKKNIISPLHYYVPSASNRL